MSHEVIKTFKVNECDWEWSLIKNPETGKYHVVNIYEGLARCPNRGRRLTSWSFCAADSRDVFSLTRAYSHARGAERGFKRALRLFL